ncbi:hypothetical protein [Microvirga lotononidis]|uniref:hypothetical protein n=1 Tax=Microvirga lotononidis TaxID=864069 RepID=UPI001AEC67A0|nr:hypothetical protein [Microvirga lotononidis]
MTSSRDTSRLTPAEIEDLREDNRRAAELARELIRAEKKSSKNQGPHAVEAILEVARQMQAAPDARK